MSSAASTLTWQVAGRTVCGASHKRRGVGNQDAMGWAQAGPCGTAVAVADGHGSPASYRSAEGSALAVQIALSTMQEFACKCPEYHTQAQEAAAQFFPKELVARWRIAVTEHCGTEPRALGANPWVIYGSTLLCVLATASYSLYAQLGDGDILMVTDQGEVTRPWPRDTRLLGVETTSLAGRDAAKDFQVLLEPISDRSPALVVLATDGYANSFREEAGFLRIGQDLLNMIHERGLRAVENDLEHWLNETSELGSGDDITIAMVCRANAGAGDGA